MSDVLDELFDDANAAGEPAPEQGGKGLRAQLEQVLEQNRLLQEQLGKVQAAERDRTLGGLFSKHGIPELARDFFPAGTDPSDESVTEFAQKYGQLWGQQATTATTPPAEQAAASAAQSFAANAGTVPAEPLGEEQIRARFNEAKTRDELMAQIAEFEQMSGA